MRRLIAITLAGALLAACGSGADAQSTPAGSSPASASAMSPPPAPPTTSPFSGRDGGVDTPVVIVKLDNTRNAQPHVNLVDADIVYVEPVEWGLTRLAAVFSTSIPQVVGPVRSARISDIDVFAPFGNVAFVFSGAQQRLVPKLLAAKWTTVAQDLGSGGFYRDDYRFSPYNLMARPRDIVAGAGSIAQAQDIGLVFADEKLPGGRRAKVVTARWPESQMQFRWRAATDAYDVWVNGQRTRDTADPGVQRASTVIVQYVKEVDSTYGDRDGGATPKSIVIGSGTGLVLRDGRAHKITWKRPTEKDPTVYYDDEGLPITLAPGQVWVLLMDRTRTVSIDKPASGGS